MGSIHVNITGGLGNQLFQYAFARYLQNKTGYDILLNTYELDTYDKKREFELDKYILNDRVKREKNRLPWYVHRRNYISKILRNLSPRLYYSFFSLRGCYIWYGEEHIDCVCKNIEDDIYVGGYWQSPAYFADIVDVLRTELVLKEKTRDSEAALIGRIMNSESICLHVRRGDYVNSDYEVCTLDYYNKAIECIKAVFRDPVFYVFSNDIDWCKQNINAGGDICYVEGNRAAVMDLFLMSLCTGFIISNSTFSWWAQYLSNNENKIVCAPSVWHKKKNNIELYLPEWKIIV